MSTEPPSKRDQSETDADEDESDDQEETTPTPAEIERALGRAFRCPSCHSYR